MNCPLCNVELKMADRQGVEIDYCPQCRGVWLDRGELDKIIERSMTVSGFNEPRQGYQGEHRDYDHHDKHEYDDRYHKRKKRSFLGEIFDFD
ncbi:MAG: zf-TFIIB domain-containing protein [Bacillota bacterium]